MKYKGFVRFFCRFHSCYSLCLLQSRKGANCKQQYIQFKQKPQMDQNCMSCYNQDEGWYAVAGTAHHTNNSTAQNVLVKLYTLPNGA